MRTYCHRCGSKYAQGKEQPWNCSGCGAVYYENPRAATDVALFDKDGRVLVSERAVDPAKGKINLPGGFAEKGETLEQSAIRELHEELDLQENDYTELIYVCSIPADYPFGKEIYDLVVPIFTALVKNPEKIKSQDDSASVEFVEMSELSNVDFSLEIYPEIIKKAHHVLFREE